MKINNITQYKYNTNFGKKYNAPKVVVRTAEKLGWELEDIIHSGYASNLRKGKRINSGTYADVYTLRGWPNKYVVRIERVDNCTQFNPKELIPSNDKKNSVLYETRDGVVSIRKRIIGKPLHGLQWRTDKTPSADVFRETMAELSALPDKTYENYIDDIVGIRNRGFDIDTWNPNNYLLDKKNKRINIIDLSNTYHSNEKLSIKDFFPLIDSKRLSGLCYMPQKISRDELADTVTKFLDRMIAIARKKGYELQMEPVAQEPLDQFYQNYAILLYNRATILFK